MPAASSEPVTFAGLEKKYRHDADLAADYGPDLLTWGVESPSYEVYVGLWMNRDRQMCRRGLGVAIGAGLALGGGDPAIFREVADSDAQAAELVGRWQAAQREREAEAARRKGGR